MLPEDRLNFSRLDPETTNLQLMVEAPQVFQFAAWQPADQIARAVETPPRLAAEGVGDELLRGQLIATQVAPRQACAANV